MDNFLMGTILGDTNISLTKDRLKARLRMSHTKEHEGLILAKYNILKEYVGTPPKLSINQGFGGHIWRFQTLSNEIFLPYYHMTWKGGKRVIPLDKLKNISMETLAWWIMDDGTGSKRGGISISTYRYPVEQVVQLRKLFIQQGLNCREDKKELQKGNKISFTSDTSRMIAQETYKYFVDCVKYKIEPLLQVSRDVTCVVCGEVFSVPSSCNGNFRYCNEKWCQRIKRLCIANKWSIEKATEVLNRKCIICGKQLPIEFPAVRKICSDACVRIQARENYKLSKLKE